MATYPNHTASKMQSLVRLRGWMTGIHRKLPLTGRLDVSRWRTQAGAIACARGAGNSDKPIKLGSGYYPGMQSARRSIYRSLQIIHTMDNLQG
jgi:hypothetical protein